MNERLGEVLAIARRKSARPTKSAPAPAPPADLDDPARQAYESRPKAPELPEQLKPEKKPRRPTGRKALPSHLPADEHVLRPETCAQCGGTALDLADEIVETKLDVIKEHHRRRVVRRKTCRCRTCGARTTATSLPAPYARSKVTSAWLAWLVSMKFAMLVPLDRIRRDLATRGIALSMSFLVSLIERAADLLGPVDGHHWRDLLAGDWMATDATGLKVVVPGLPGSHHGHIEVYRRDDVVVFQYEHDKGSEALVNKLGTFTGKLVADAEHRHNRLFVDGRIVESGCNAHGRRKFRDAEAVQPALAAEGGAFIAAMYEAEARARERGLAGDVLREWRQEKMRPLKGELRAWMEAVRPTLVPSDPLLGVISYYQNHWDALFR
ncbi:MAG TPA: IS66 family transposase, partial [Microbacterium sp.]|nr:IS66 family transposase [Microbacterium sp.]